MATLYLTMTEKLIAHWKGNSNAYPKKFILSPAQRDDYLKCLSWMTLYQGREIAMPATHMGVPLEVADNTPGVMVAAEGTEVSLQ